MDILNLLFNPNGRISPRVFWRGVVVLVAVMIVLSVAGVYGGPMFAAVFGMLTWLMPYPYLCVYGKRLHDSGRTAWFFLAAFIVYVIAASLLELGLVQLLAPRAVELRSEMEMLMRQGQWMDALAYGPEIAREQMIPSLLALFLVNAGIGYVVASLRSDPGPNQYGPPTGGGEPDLFE